MGSIVTLGKREGGIFVPDDIVRCLVEPSPVEYLYATSGLDFATIKEGREACGLTVRGYDGKFTADSPDGDAYIDADGMWIEHFGGPPQCVITKHCLSIAALERAIDQSMQRNEKAFIEQMESVTIEDVSGMRGIRRERRRNVWDARFKPHFERYKPIALDEATKFLDSVEGNRNAILNSLGVPKAMLQ